MEDDDDFTDWLIAREECIMDLDEGEVNKDIEFIKELIEQNKIDIKGVSYGKQYSILRTIKIILAERETDKKKIAELEEKLELIDLRKIKIELKMYKDFVTNRGIKAEFDMWKKVKVEEER